MAQERLSLASIEQALGIYSQVFMDMREETVETFDELAQHTSSRKVH